MNHESRPDLSHDGIHRGGLKEQEVPAVVKTPMKFITNDRPEIHSGPPVEEGYGLDGRVAVDPALMVAKKVTGAATTYHARFSTTGGDRGKILNPYGMNFGVDDFKNGKKVRGHLRYEFREISHEAYALYTRFLATRLDGVLAAVERIVTHG